MQFDDNENEPLNSRKGKKVGAVNETQNDNSTIVPDQDGNDGGDNEKKRKYIKWGIIGAIILIVLTLAIVLPIILGKKNPVPPTPTPPFDKGINYYKVTNITKNAYSLSGEIKYDETLQSESFLQKHV